MSDQTGVLPSQRQQRSPLLDNSGPAAPSQAVALVLAPSITTVWFQKWRSAIAFLAFGIATVPLIGLGYALRPFEAPIDPSNYAARAERILSTTPLIDGHNDLPHLIQVELYGKMTDGSFNFNDRLLGHTDVQRMRKGQMGGQFWSVFVECAAVENINDPTVSLYL